jgi:hypothetical protein
VSDLKDFEFDNNDKDDELDELSTGRYGSGDDGGSRRWWLIALVLVALVGAIAYWMTRAKPSDPAAAAPSPTATSERAPRTEAEPVEPIELPELDASDALVSRLVSALSSNPRLAGLLAGDDLVRRFTVAMVNISEGQAARAHLKPLEPAEPFTVRRVGSDLVPAAKSYDRYDTVATVISSLDTEGTVRLYRQLEPLIDQAFADLGYPGRDFDEVLVASLDHLIATPVVDDDVELVEKVEVYTYADPKLEALSPAQKQLLRTGPENMRKIQATLRALRRALTQGG